MDTFKWNFSRIGGLDQATLETAEELRHLGELDPKLWMALSCPTAGLQFDARVLHLLDSDGDGRIRIPDVIGAVRWTVDRLVDPASLVKNLARLPLDFIRQDTGDGRLILASAKRMLANQGLPDSETIGPEEVGRARDSLLKSPLNGDGIIPVHAELEEGLRQYVNKIIAVVGSKPDINGEPGVDVDLLDKFVARTKEYQEWAAQTESLDGPLGKDSWPAYQKMLGLAPKIDDYFARCRLVGYDHRAESAVNVQDSVLSQFGEQPLCLDSLIDLPLAHALAGRPLPLHEGLNPAWLDKMQEFDARVIRPLLGEASSLSEEDWIGLKDRFGDQAALASARPGSAVRDAESLSETMNGGQEQKLRDLFAKDQALAPVIQNIWQVEKLVLYHTYLHCFLMNFVSFCNFYAKDKPSIFEKGILYIDSRSCRLCMQVSDIEAHAAAAKFSWLCLAYCACTRQGSAETMSIVAAITAGDAEFLTPGRHGVFVDTDEVIWDATLVKLVENPSSIRVAMVAPYRRFGRMIAEQIEKFAAARDAALVEKSTAALNNITTGVEAGQTPPAPAPFDIGKSAGILAAVGLALGALGTALATITASVLRLSWWEIPLLILGILACISGPSMVLAWLKLRKRALGPVLDASGWAVNSHIPINFSLGGFLTSTARLPANARHLGLEPLRRGRKKTWLALVFVVAVAVGATVFFLYKFS